MHNEFDEQLKSNPEYVFYMVESRNNPMNIHVEKHSADAMVELKLKLNSGYQFLRMNGAMPRYRKL